MFTAVPSSSSECFLMPSKPNHSSLRSTHHGTSPDWRWVANGDWDTDVAVSSAEKLVTLKPTPEAHTVFAQALTLKYAFTKDDSEKQKVMSQAEKEARLAVTTTRAPSAEAYSVLANVLEDRGSYRDAKMNFSLALDAAKKVNDSDLRL